MMPRLPLADAADLLTRSRRTNTVRLSLAAVVTGVAVAAIWVGTRTTGQAVGLAQDGRRTVVVLDVSTSIKPTVFDQIDMALERSIRDGGELGLVVFSDSAYELLAPGTPARELEGVARFFRALRSRPEGAPTVALGSSRFLRAPWAQSLSNGTRISAGLEAARWALERDARGRGSVVLVSDLGDEMGDLPALAAQIELLARDRIPLRVVALSPEAADLRLFRNLLAGHRGSISRAPSSPKPLAARQLGDAGSLALTCLAAALLLLLAVNEIACARLVVRRPAEAS
jgi:hypothetical protein